VRGDGLRLVVIPRLPFRVPTEPLSEARFERIRDRGGDPFRAWSLPEAVLKLRQGFGRLVRSKGDRGAVMVLDRRLHEAWYGRVFLGSLPDARRVVGPLRAVIEHLAAFYQRHGVTEGPP
jgi:ATP-dependent DNA helicase DinG